MTLISSGLLPTDDDGSGTTGTKQNNSFWAGWRNALNTLISSLTNPTLSPADIIDEVVLARGSQATLDARLDAGLSASGTILRDAELTTAQADITALQLEVANGRGSEASLDARFDTIEAAIAAKGQNSTAAGNSLAAATDVHSYTIPANTLNAQHERLEAEFEVTFAANANNKSIIVSFGSSAFAVAPAAAYNGMTGKIRVIVTRRATSVLSYVHTSTMIGISSGTPFYQELAGAAGVFDMSTALTLKLTVQSGAASSNDIVCQSSCWKKH